MLRTQGATLRALHAPGHAQDHLCFMLEEEGALFSGDNVLGVGTTVIPAHGGDLLDYLRSLERLLAQAPRAIYPAHGPRIADGEAKIREYIAHRHEREAQILAALDQGLALIPEMVRRIYAGYPESLHPAAAMSVASHLRKLEREGSRDTRGRRPALGALEPGVSHPILSRLASDERRGASARLPRGRGRSFGGAARARARRGAGRRVERRRARGLPEPWPRSDASHAAVGEALREALRAQDPRRRIQAAFTLARLEPPEPRSLPALVAALDSEDGDVRWTATRILVEMGRLHGEVLRVLLNLASDGSPRVRRMALCGLRELAPGEPEVARTLLAASRDADLGVRRAALTALAALEEPPPAVRERLVETAASDPDAASRRLAEVALDLLGSARPVADAP